MKKISFQLNKTTLIITILLLAMHQFCYLVPNVIMGFLYDYLLFIFCLVFLGFYFLKYHKTFFKGYFKNIILLVPLLVFASSVMAFLNYSQGLLSGIMTQRAWIISFFLYFPLLQLVLHKKLDLTKLENILYFVVALELIIYFIQYLIGSSNMFLHVNNNIRYGTLRLYCNTNYMLIVMVIAIEKVIKKKNVIKNAIYVIMILLYILLVNKSRGIAMTYLITLVSMVVLTKSNLIYKNIIIFCSSIIGVNYFIKAKSIQEFMLVIFEGKKDFTYSVRLDSQVHFLDKWKSNLGTILFGYGYPNSNRIESNIATGATQGYLLADNGMYGYLMCYGILGIMVYILYLIKFLIRAIKIYIKNRDCKLIAIFISILTGIATNGGFFITFYSFETILIMILSDIIWSESYNNKYDSRS